MTMVSENSIRTYRDHVEPTLSQRQKDVFEVIKKYPEGITIYETAMKLGVFPNHVSGRFSELVSKDLIILSGEFKKINGGKTNHGIWILTEKGKQTNL